MVKPSKPCFSQSRWLKEGEIQVLLRTKAETWVPGMRWREGTIWMEEEPAPMTPMRLFVKSYLALVSMLFPGETR